MAMRPVLAVVALIVAAAVVTMTYRVNGPALAAVHPALLIIVISAVMIPGIALGRLFYAGRVGARLRLKPYLASVIVLAGSAFMILQLVAQHDGWFQPNGLWAWADVAVLYIYTELIVALAIVAGVNRWKGRRKKARDASGHPGSP